MNSTNTLDIIFTPPPTPNGGLHVGHVAGPYLRADLNNKLRKVIGASSAHLSHVDNYQTYVAKKASELNRETEEFRLAMINQINEDFRCFKIDFDLKIDNTEGYYRRFLSACLTELFLDSRAVSKREFAGADHRHTAAEAYVSGTCPDCLQRAFANVCENCGRPLAIHQMIRPVEELTGATVFTERTSDGIPNYLAITEEDVAWIRGQCRNIAIDSRFVQNLLAKLTAHDVALTLRSAYGFSIADGRVINPWIEIFFAHMYSLGRLLGIKPDCTLYDIREALHANRHTRVSYYFGVDNSYYYCVLFLLLAKIMKIEDAIPVALKANRFLKLSHSKMSSSKNNAIWARDIAGKLPVPSLRSALIASCPEHTEIEFNPELLANHPPSQSFVSDSKSIFDRPATGIGQRFRSALIDLSDPRNFSTEDLLNKINKATEFVDSGRAKADEAEELKVMIVYLTKQLDI